MNTYVTSDLHFGHANIMKFCPKTRGHFSSVQEMNEAMVKEWNNTVKPTDKVYILGDVAFLNPKDAVEIVNRLHGLKILVQGNHDRKLLHDRVFRACFIEVHQYLDIKYNDNKIVMFHYPIAEWDRMHRGSLHFHGHLHGSKSGLENFRARDVSFDATGKIVWLMEDAIADALTGQIKGHHQIGD